MPFALYWPHHRAYQPLFGPFGGPITGLLSISTKGGAFACSCACSRSPLHSSAQGGFKGASKGLVRGFDKIGRHASRRVGHACSRLASALLAIARRCVQQCSAYVSDLYGNTLCHWHAFGMRLACDRIASRFNRYISVTDNVTQEATS